MSEEYLSGVSKVISLENQLAGNKRIIEELSAKLIRGAKTNLAHQQLNGKLQIRLTEVEDDNKKLAKQIQDLTKLRQFGDGTY
jgi:uncharacterized protein involved in exopolysaccharide biosynthesis